MAADRKHIFVTALGSSKAETDYPYQLMNHVYHAPLAPLALLEHLKQHDKPDRILVLATKGALETTWRVFQAKCQQFNPECIEIRDGRDDKEVNEILEIVAQKVPKKSSLTLDVTHGFRHFPFIMYALALYLRSLKDIEIKGAYYGMLEGFLRDDVETPRPILNLQPLLDLPEWFFAIRMFRETGSARALHTMIASLSEKIHQNAKQNNNNPDMHKKAAPFNNLKKTFEEITYAYESGMPKEMGKISRKLQSNLNEDFVSLLRNYVPLAGDLNKAVREDIARFESNNDPTCLDEDELERQARMIDLYLQRSQLTLAIGLLREWVVSWMIFKSGSQSNWLKHDERGKAERQLGLFKALAQEKYDDEKIKEWGDFWSQLTKLRNSLHHHGMRDEGIKFPPSQLNRLKTFFERLRNNEIDLPTFGGGKGRLLITPQGLSAGVLYSAIRKTNPDYCLVICSTQSEATIQNSITRLGFQGNVQHFVLHNPNQFVKEDFHSYFDQNKKLFIEADEVIANLTGGTTIMGLIVQQFIEKAQHYNRHTKRCILIDSRSPEEQRSDPYQLSEITWLDKEEGDHDAND